jgi:hypothetical protein
LPLEKSDASLFSHPACTCPIALYLQFIHPLNFYFMKKVLLTFLAILPLAFLSAQNCTPDPAYQDSTGVFPMPYDANNPAAGGGINECAVIGEDFNFVFTVAVGDSITLPGSPQAAALDKVVVLEVNNLPVGINYVCEPTNCSFEKNTLGCVVLSGIPTAANTAMAYEMEIKVNVFISGLPFPIPITFPDNNLAPGVYSLQLLANASDPCDAVATDERLADQVKMAVQPNPTAGPITVNVHADIFGKFEFQVVDFLGKSVHRETVQINEGQNYIDFDGSFLPNGLYILVLENELGRIAQKMTIQH